MTQQRIPPFTLIILNTSAALPPFLPLLLRHHPKVICADGAADLLYNFPPNTIISSTIPEFIVGDLDSVSHKTLDHYRRQGTEIIDDRDENRCDFAKSLDVATRTTSTTTNPSSPNEALPRIVVVGGVGKDFDRFDQTLGNINRLYCAAQRGIIAYWLGQGGWAMILIQGQHKLKIDPTQEGPMCALLPVGGPVSMVVSDGLKWNVHGEMKFGLGGLISTSNQVVGPIVHIDTSGPLLWWCELKSKGEFLSSPSA